MPAAQAPGDRATFERLVASTATSRSSAETIRDELRGQLQFEPEPSEAGLEALSSVLLRRFLGETDGAAGAIGALEQAFPRSCLVHLYGYTLRREVGDLRGARASLDALLAADPGDPMAAYFDADLRGESVVPASEEQRLANIAKLATTPLLGNPYALAVGTIFDAIRSREHARVLDVGTGSGAQMAALVSMLGREPNRLRRLTIVGLDPMPEFLATAGDRIADAAEALGEVTEVAYEPVEGRIEALEEPAHAAIAGEGLDAANATISLHEVPGEAKLAALGSLRRLAPGRLVIAEWNYRLENVLPQTSTEFVFNVRSVAAAMAASLRERHTIEEARAVVRDWLSQGSGQLTCPSERRQECFLEVAAWRALLEHSRFDLVPIDPAVLAYAPDPGRARLDPGGWYLETSRYAGGVPIALLTATPSGR